MSIRGPRKPDETRPILPLISVLQQDQSLRHKATPSDHLVQLLLMISKQLHDPTWGHYIFVTAYSDNAQNKFPQAMNDQLG